MQLRILRGFLVRVAWEALGDFAPLRSLQLAALLLVSVVSSLRLTLNAPRRKRGAGALAEGQRCLATGLFHEEEPRDFADFWDSAYRGMQCRGPRRGTSPASSAARLCARAVAKSRFPSILWL